MLRRLFVPALCALALGARAEDDIDLTEVCFELAVIQEPDVDLGKLKAGIEDLEAKVKARADGSKQPREVVKAFNDTLLLDRKVSYVSNKYWRDSTLAASVLRGRGNCLSTSTLYAIVAQRLKLPIKVVIIPGHAFARFDDGVTRINIETTNGGRELPDSTYRTMGSWTDDDVPPIGWGQSMSSREFAAFLHATAASHLCAEERHEDALSRIDEALLLWPRNQMFQIDRLWYLYDGLGRREEAVSGFERFAQSSYSPEIRARSWIGFAHNLAALDAHADALVILRDAFSDAPKSVQPGVLSAMATSYRALRRFSEALLAQDLAIAATAVPQAEEYTTLAILYKNAGLLDDAIRCLRKALEINPESWSTRLVLAGYLIRAKRDDEGWEMFKTVEKPPIDEESFETNLAWFYGAVGMKAEFLEHLGKALELADEPSILSYVSMEVDFDAYRKDPDFVKLLEGHRKRLVK